MNQQQKETVVREIREKIASCACAVVTDYSGMNVASMQKLRQEMRRSGLEMKVVKNTLFLKAIEGRDFAEKLKPFLKGMTAVTWSREEVGTPVRVILDFRKEDERLRIKCGILDGKALGPDEVELLASLPSKEQIKAGLLALLNTPAQRLLSVLQAPVRNFLYLLEAYQAKKAENKGE